MPVSEVAQIAQATDLSTLEKVLLMVFASGVIGVGGLITWCVKSLVPRILGLMEERNKTLVTAVEKMSGAIDDFDRSLDQHGDRIVGEVKITGDKVVGEVRTIGDRVSSKIDDRRYEELRAELKKLGPDDSGGHVPPSVRLPAKSR